MISGFIHVTFANFSNVQKQRNVSLWIDIKIFQNKSISVNN